MSSTIRAIDGSRLRFKYLERSFVVLNQKEVPSQAYQTGVSCGPPAARLTPTMAWFGFERSSCISWDVMIVCSPVLIQKLRAAISARGLYIERTTRKG